MVIATTVFGRSEPMEEVLLQAVAIEVDVAMEGHVPHREGVGLRGDEAPPVQRPVEVGEATQRPLPGCGLLVGAGHHGCHLQPPPDAS